MKPTARVAPGPRPTIDTHRGTTSDVAVKAVKASLQHLEEALDIANTGDVSMDSIQDRLSTDAGALAALKAVSDAFERTVPHVEKTNRGSTISTYVQVPPNTLKPHEVRLARDAVTHAKGVIERHDTENSAGRLGADGKISPTESARANISARALAPTEAEPARDERRARLGEQLGAAVMTGLENDLLDHVATRQKVQLTFGRVAGELKALVESGANVPATDIESALLRLPNEDLAVHLSQSIKNHFPEMKEVTVRRAEIWSEMQPSPASEVSPKRMKLLIQALDGAQGMVAAAGARGGALTNDDLKGLVQDAWKHQKQPRTGEKDEDGWRPNTTWWSHKFVELVALSCLAPDERPKKRDEPIGVDGE